LRLIIGVGDPSHRKRFEQEALAHLDALFTTALHLTRNRDHANDLCQETMLRAYRSFYEFQPGTDCRSWLLTILYNVFRSGYSRQRRREQISATTGESDTTLENQSNRAATKGSNPEALLFEDSLNHDVENALQSLPEELKTALLLVDVNELSYEQAARAMAVPIGTVRARLSRARTMMRYALHRCATGARRARDGSG
jgi:RNA polymerase sigma-70 factor, ECF subfamily